MREEEREIMSKEEMIKEATEMVYTAEPEFKGFPAKHLSVFTARSAHNIYEAMEKNGILSDSWTRESLFQLASIYYDVDYDVFYNAWLEQRPIDEKLLRR